MLAREEVKPLIPHPVQMVRDFAADYFSNRNYQSDDLMQCALEAADKYCASKCIGVLTTAREF